MLGIRDITTLLVCLVAMPAAALDFDSPLISDPIESQDGWATPSVHWGTGIGGLTPSAGSEFWGSTFNQEVTIGMSKSFTGVLVEPGAYRFRIDVAQPLTSVINYNPVPYSDFGVLGLTGISSSAVVISAVTPPAGVADWTTWEIAYTVQAGSPDVGNTLGFEMSYDNPPSYAYSMMIDNLEVAYVPEPSGLALLGLSGLLLARGRRR